MLLKILKKLCLLKSVIVLSSMIAIVVTVATFLILWIVDGYVEILAFYLSFFLSFVLTTFLIYNFGKLLLELDKTGNILKKNKKKLEMALSEVKSLGELIPICANCKKIRDDKGYWNQIEQYISEHTDSHFSHGICPDCMRELYPDLFDKNLTNS